MNKKIVLNILIFIIGLGVWSQTYSYNVDKAVSHLNTNALSKSHTCCAWFVMRAMQAGGCPIGIYPAWAYSKVLPKYGFVEVKTTTYQKGDIIVFPAIKNHKWGHIAMWNGNQWVSDFKQKSIFPVYGYRYSGHKIFRYGKNK